MARKRTTASGYAGVEIRANGDVRLRVWYCGEWVAERCHHPATPGGLKKAAAMRKEVNRQSRAGIIQWSEWFPQSARSEAPATVPSFNQVSTSYLRRKERRLKPSTYKGYEKWVKFWQKIYGTIPIDQIRRSHVLDALDVIGWDNGKTMSNALTPLRGIFEEALLDDLITKTPVMSIDLPRTQKKPCNPLSSAQMQAFLAYLHKHKHPWTAYFEIAFGTGMRPSEIMGLKWPDVDLRANTVRIHNARTDGIDTGSTKVVRERTIELNPLARRAFQKQRFVTRANGYVVINPATGEPIRTDQDGRRQWTKILTKVGLEHRRAYETRHTHATIRLAAGEPLIVVSRDLGHLKPSMTQDNYQGWIADERSDLAKQAFA